MPNHDPNLHLGVLYLGGTIGCAGAPLTPLPAHIFLPHFAEIFETAFIQKDDHAENTQKEQPHRNEWHYFSGNIKDSSALVPEDWGNILELLLNPIHTHIKHWIILHGTDTLAFTAAFLSEALRGTDLKIVVTGSQFPLLDPIELTFAPQGDAFSNIKTAYSAFVDQQVTDKGWVRVAFNQQHWTANGVQKTHTQDIAAFTGDLFKQSQNQNQKNLTIHINTLISHPTRFKEALSRLNIQIYYASPLPLNILIAQFEQVLLSGAEAVILLAYGLGNFPDDLRIHRALLAAEQRGVIVILSTQVPFGGIESRYAAGNWLAACGVLSGGALPLPAIFARLAWLQMTVKTYSERRQLWLEYIATFTH